MQVLEFYGFGGYWWQQFSSQQQQFAMISDTERFTEGDCWILAKTFHRLTGWKLCAFSDHHGFADDHGFVIMPDGRVLDVEGPQQLHLFCKKWGYKPSDVLEYRPSDFNGNGPAFGNYSYRRARIVAEKLLKELG